MSGITRREVLHGVLGAAALAGCRAPGDVRASASASTSASLDVPKDLIVRLDDPFCGEPPLAALASDWITPVQRFFVLDHAAPPRLRGDHVIEVTGLVRRPRRLRLRDLERRTSVTVPATLMCAGNRRREHHAVQPLRDPLLWDAGAIGNAFWTGVPLAEILDEAGLLAGAAHVWLDGVDGDGWGSSIPLARIVDRGAPPVLLAYGMNGAALARHHGFPVRAIVPGHVGARSVKWLHRITVAATTSPNPHFVRAHRVGGEPIYDVPINAAICRVGRRGVVGYALAPLDATVARVDVSVDDGATWQPAALLGPPLHGCWRLWAVDLGEVVPGEASRVIARAADSRGGLQPERVAWNPGGYLYNAWPRAALR